MRPNENSGRASQQRFNARASVTNLIGGEKVDTLNTSRAGGGFEDFEGFNNFRAKPALRSNSANRNGLVNMPVNQVSIELLT
jgi:hypothetical protein